MPTPKLTPREILEEVKRRITAKPESYEQETFCGSPCCIAGHLLAVVRRRKSGMATGLPGVMAADILGAKDDYPWLFTAIWVGRPTLHNAYSRAKYKGDHAGMAAVGCKAIDRYMKERGI